MFQFLGSRKKGLSSFSFWVFRGSQLSPPCLCAALRAAFAHAHAIALRLRGAVLLAPKMKWLRGAHFPPVGRSYKPPFAMAFVGFYEGFAHLRCAAAQRLRSLVFWWPRSTARLLVLTTGFEVGFATPPPTPRRGEGHRTPCTTAQGHPVFGGGRPDVSIAKPYST